MKLSDQALGAIMMALQNAIMNQTDITPILKDFDLMMGENEELIVLNPPVVSDPNIDVMKDLQEVTSTVGSD
tara:strand:- start:258 stop:473 length:216 start_codon:yes stop_codon:yes gene_type:complete